MALPDSLCADLILVNGRILTMDRHQTIVQALAIRDGKIVAVGKNQEIHALAGARTEGVDLRGRTALPGLADVHAHLAYDAGQAEEVEVRDFFDPAVRSVADIQARLREQAARTPPGAWIVARGSPMQDFRLAEERVPTRAELDAVTPRHPCYVSFGAHLIVANSLALASKDVTRDTPDPQGGRVVKDPVTGEPTGVLRERAQWLLKVHESDQPFDALRENVLTALERCAARGVTTLHEIVTNPAEMLAYQQLARAGRLPVRVQLLVRVIESTFSKESLLDLGLVDGFGSDWLKIGGIKMSIDGGVTGRNAAFSEPLCGHGHDSPGLIRIQQDELDDTIWRYHQLGMRCCVHAIGDVAMDMALQAFDKAITQLPRRDHRHRVEHLGNWMMTPERVATTRRLGILPVPNPSLLYFLGSEIVDSLGPVRTAHAFPFRSLLDVGVPLAFGSDAPPYWPVDVLRDVGTVVARTTVDGLALAPEEGISLWEALRAQTANAAYLGQEEQRLGTLEPGKLADVAVLGEDPFTFPTDRFRELPVDLTISGGRVVHGR
jgi:predicted amidohydrolase YtcJ